MIEITPLGAGQDVGRSCILASINDHNILLDCGMHMGYDDERRFPDFSFISSDGTRFTDLIDCVIITHFHLDHCGALPYFTEMCGYDGPVYMTHPTRAIAALLLEDYRKISVERKGEQNFFTSEDIANCMRKVIPINLHQTIRVTADLEIKLYYAGHVLGAAMIHVRSGNSSLVYTGDYNMTADRHLGSAWIDRVVPDVLITESTYGTTIRDSKKARESDFLQRVHDCVNQGGKVLIPVFALGRAQELCILIESYWERMNLKVPVYFSGGMTQKANSYYRLYINWTNQKVKQTYGERNMFDFRHIKPFDMAYADNAGPQVLFASPGMLHAGLSLEVFRKWAGDSNNMLIMPGYCVPGTVGARVLSGASVIETEKGPIEVKLQVKHLSFSAHADSKGIMQLIEQCGAKSVVLVHGEARKMETLNAAIKKEFNIPCHYPANGHTVTFQKEAMIEVDVSPVVFRPPSLIRQDDVLDAENITPLSSDVIQGKLNLSHSKRPRLEPLDTRKLMFTCTCSLLTFASVKKPGLKDLWTPLKAALSNEIVRLIGEKFIEIRSVIIQMSETYPDSVAISWEQSVTSYDDILGALTYSGL
eukprot:Partr_v1_DN28588_c1_g1_i1_m73022 putative cleavage and polyadenylation specificity factor